MSHAKSRARTLLEIAAAVVVLGAVFLWSESLLSDKVGPDDVAAAAGREGAEGRGGAKATVESRQLPVEVEALGTVRPAREAAIASRVMGVVERVAVDEGDRVARGDLLVELAAPELAARGLAARQQVDAAQAKLQQAERDLARTETLVAKDAATAVELEQARTDVSVARATLATARQAARGEETVASYTTLRAPIAGLVVARLVDPGDLATPGRPLLRVEGEGLFRLEAPLPERFAGRVRVGDPVGVVLDASAVEVAGTVVEVHPAADPGSRTVLVKVELPQGGELGQRSGQFGRARLVVGERAGVVAPAAAVRRVGGLATARVVTPEGRVVMRHLRLGASVSPGLVEVLSGLQAGETVVLFSQTATPVAVAP